MNIKRKSISALTVIVSAALLLIVLVVVVLVFRTYFGKEAGIVGEQIESLGDCDCDGVRNFMDKCPCEPGEDNAELSGCKVGVAEAKPCNSEQCEQAKKSHCKR